jgi:hypothetical protein
MTDVAAGSNAALQLQRNMAAAPDVQQMQTNVMQEQANTLQQQQENVEKTKLANLVADTGIKADADIKNKIQNLIKDDSYIKSSPSDQVLKMASIVGESGRPEDMAKLIDASERITTRELLNQSKKTGIERQLVADASSVFELAPNDQVNNRFDRLPEETRNLIISKVGPENWKNFSPVEKKAVIKNLFETGDNKLREQQFANNIALAEIRAKAEVDKTQLRLANSERLKVLGDEKLVQIWNTVNTQLGKIQNDARTVAEFKRLDEEVDKAQTAATRSTTFGSLTSYKPEGSDVEFYSKDSFNKWQQATTKRDKFTQKQLLEEKSLIENLPTEVGSIKSNMLKKIDAQLSTLQLEEPGAKKKPEAAAPVPTPAKPDVPSNKPTSAPVVSESIAPKLPAEYSKEVNSRKDLTPEQKKEQIDRYTNGFNQIKKQEADLTARAKADPTMKGNKFGKYVDEKGVEVFDSNGKLIGHYK